MNSVQPPLQINLVDNKAIASMTESMAKANALAELLSIPGRQETEVVAAQPLGPWVVRVTVVHEKPSDPPSVKYALVERIQS